MASPLADKATPDRVTGSFLSTPQSPGAYLSAPMIFENIPVEQLIPYAKNARTHDDAQVAQIAASIREFGWTNPILIDGDKGLIAGHGRLMAARKLGMDTVPCIELSGMTDTQKRAYILADNKLAMNAGWDDEILSLQHEEAA